MNDDDAPVPNPNIDHDPVLKEDYVPNPANGAVAPEPQVAILTISFNIATHEVGVNGPIKDKALCYMMLEMARDAIQAYVDELRTQLEAKRIVPAFKMPRV